MINRRMFLKAGVAALPLASLTQSSYPAHGEILEIAETPVSGAMFAPDADLPWQRKLRRIGQTNFTEHDPVVLNVDEWADYWASLKVGAVFISVTGILAFYQTKVPFHRKGKFLGTRDFFGDLNTAAKKRGLRTVARMSPDLNWADALEAHPEWFMRDEQGNPKTTADDPQLFMTCMFSTYMTDYIPAIIREINSMYDMDAHFTNGWPSFGLPVCYCNQCRQLPPPGTPAYWDKFNERVIYLWNLYDSIAKEKKTSSFYFANLGGGIRASPNLARLGEIAQWYQCDNQGRGGEDEPVWGCSQQGRVCNSVLDGKMATNVTGAWSTGSIRWRLSVKSPAEIQMWFGETLASGMVPYYHFIGGEKGFGEDRRWEKIGDDYFNWTAKHDQHFTNKGSIANIGVLFGQRTELFYRPPHDVPMREYMAGMYYALLEGRFFFDFVHEDKLQPERLKKYAALILPNTALLSDEQCRQLRDYVDQGGSLLATFETSMYTEQNERRADFGLADVFGIHLDGVLKGRRGNSNPFYARIERQHPILDGFTDTDWLPGAEYRLPVTSAENNPVLTIVPSFPAYPPELSYPPTPQTKEPAVVLLEKGKSRLVYFPGDIERTMWRSGHTDLSQLLQNSIRWVAGAPPVTVEGDGLIESFAWETEAGFAVHILNYTNPNAHRGWIRKFYPIGEQKVRFQVPAGRRVTRVELLRAGANIPFHLNGGMIEFTIPSVADYEVAALSAT
jgi:Hypothetical glycosyl hydrolase 6/Beta-galactosidase trimerisation domain